MSVVFRRVLSLSWLVLLVLALAVGIALASGRVRVVNVLSGSMRPHLQVGTLLVERPEAGAKVNVGDVITFLPHDGNGTTVTHRVVKIETAASGARVAVTKGDANTTPDPWRAQLSGNVWHPVAHVPVVGRLLMDARSHGWLPLAAVLLPFALAAAILRSIWAQRPESAEPSESSEESAAVVAPAAAEEREPVLV